MSPSRAAHQPGCLCVLVSWSAAAFLERAMTSLTAALTSSPRRLVSDELCSPTMLPAPSLDACVHNSYNLMSPPVPMPQTLPSPHCYLVRSDPPLLHICIFPVHRSIDL